MFDCSSRDVPSVEDSLQDARVTTSKNRKTFFISKRVPKTGQIFSFLHVISNAESVVVNI